ncbi:MAG: DUF6279 family lipoprotein [Bacteriovorax sp.]|nr:DUF6279 family lipoprotein [Bacteriovorax sp.]
MFRKVDNYFDLTNVQSQLVKNSLKEDIYKIRKGIFPLLGKQLNLISDDIKKDGTLNLQKIISHKVEFFKIFDKTLIVLEPNVQGLIDVLNPEQLIIFKKEFDNQTKDLGSDKRYDKIEKQFEDWMGNLETVQQIEIYNFCKINPILIKEQRLNRQILTDRFVESFSDKKIRKEFIHKLFYNYNNLREEHYAKVFDEDQRRYLELVAVVLNTMTDGQRKYLLATLKDRAEQIEKASLN